jgi:hypothetical protein
MHDAPQVRSAAEVDILYLIYGLGFAGVWSLYGLLYWHAWRKREELGLTESEMILTRADLWANFIYVFVCLLSVLLAFTIENPAIPGLIYWALAWQEGGEAGGRRQSRMTTLPNIAREPRAVALRRRASAAGIAG